MEYLLHHNARFSFQMMESFSAFAGPRPIVIGGGGRGLCTSLGKCKRGHTESKSRRRFPEIKYMFNDHFSSFGQTNTYQPGSFNDYFNKRDAKGKLFIYSSNNYL